MKLAKKIESLLLICGLCLLIVFAGFRIFSAVVSHAELTRFENLKTRQAPTPPSLLANHSFKLNFSLWSEKRIAAYEQSLAKKFDPPLAVLRITKVGLEVPVLEGTNDLILDRGVGHIQGTVLPGEDGNVGIAGHRDGFFRVLKDVKPGDAIDVIETHRTDRYIVDRIVLVRPEDVSVLQPRSGPSLTLVTCYPFYYIGSAPQRYIVQASLSTSSPVHQDNQQKSFGSENTALAQNLR